MRGELQGRDGLHAVVVPWPLQGHITPALQLARRLAALGFRITFVNTRSNHDRLMHARSRNSHDDDVEIRFVSVADVSYDGHRLQDAVGFCKGLLEMGPAFERLFHELQLPVTCIITDSRFTAVHNTARKMPIRVAALVTSSAISTQCNLHLAALLASGVLPLPPPRSESLTLGPPRSDAEAAARNAPLTCVPGAAPSMRVGDLSPSLLTHGRGSFWHWLLLETQNPLLEKCDCVVVNSFEGMEGQVVEAMGGVVFAVGPLGMDVGPGTASLWEEDRQCVFWLDERGRGSVLYVSLGSLAVVSGEQMREFAAGLEMSGCAFVWAVRPDLVCESVVEPVARARDRALVVPWAPQAAVLAHPAVGAFLTHCGWNSILESVASGVPMIAWPRVADQNTNSRYLTDVWRIGMRFESEVRDGSAVVAKEEVARKVRQILAADGVDVEVDAIRANSKRLQMAAREAVAEGGSSHTAMTAFVELMASPPQPS